MIPTAQITQWISTKDKLPIPGEEVLGVVCQNNFCQNSLMNGRRYIERIVYAPENKPGPVARGRDWNVWWLYRYEGYTGYTEEEVLYWMPIPELPNDC